MERTCAHCATSICIDRENSNKAIYYKNHFYHFDCFADLCDKKVQSKRTSPMWVEAKANIEKLVADTTQKQRIEVAKNELNDWVLHHYDVSFMGKQFYMKLSDIYNGTYKGLAYAISPIELLDEWQYFWKDLCIARERKGIEGERAVNYDLVVLLSRNVEYRKMKEKERVSMEMKKQQIEEMMATTIRTALPSEYSIQRQNTNSKRANLFKEVVGDGE